LQHRLLKEEALAALDTIIWFIFNAVSKSHNALTLSSIQRQKLELLKKYIVLAVERAKASAHIQINDPHYIDRLFPLRIISTLIFQNPKESEVLQGYSYEKLIERQIKTALSIQEEFEEKNISIDESTRAYMRVRQLALTSELAQKFENFVIKIQHEPPTQRESFEKLIRQLHSLDILAAWLNTAFNSASNTYSNTSECLNALLNEYKDQSDYFSYLLNIKTKMQSLNVAVFSDPKSFERQWQAFEHGLLTEFLSKQFKENYERAHGLAQITALSLNIEFINEVFDKGIKALTGQSNYMKEKSF
jgi:hypothetical protein